MLTQLVCSPHPFVDTAYKSLYAGLWLACSRELMSCVGRLCKDYQYLYNSLPLIPTPPLIMAVNIGEAVGCPLPSEPPWLNEKVFNLYLLVFSKTCQKSLDWFNWILFRILSHPVVLYPSSWAEEGTLFFLPCLRFEELWDINIKTHITYEDEYILGSWLDNANVQRTFKCL